MAKDWADWATSYPFGGIDPDNPLDCACLVPFFTKYAVYARASAKGKVPDAVIDDLYASGQQLLTRAINNLRPSGVYNLGLHVQRPLGSPSLIERFAPKTRPSRLDKVVAIEKLVNTQHTSGSLLEWACPEAGREDVALDRPDRLPRNILYQRILTKIVLDLLAGEK